MRRSKPDTILEKATGQAGQAMEQVKGTAADLSERLAPMVEETRGRLGEALTDLAVRSEPMVTKVADKVAEKVAENAPENVSDKVSEVLPTSEPEKRGVFRKLLLLLGLGAVAAVVAKKVRERGSDQAWHSAGVPAPRSASSPSPAAATAGAAAAAAATEAHADDASGSSPDEAAADETEEPHRATTPDAPAETVILED